MSKSETLSEQIKNKIIDTILANEELNMDSIPDHIERQMYEAILDILEKEIVDKKCSRFCGLVKCCNKK